jgi:hypothetical protein
MPTKRLIRLNKENEVFIVSNTNFLNKSITGLLAIIGVFGGVFLLSPNLTGRAISNLNGTVTNLSGLIFFLLGLLEFSSFLSGARGGQYYIPPYLANASKINEKKLRDSTLNQDVLDLEKRTQGAEKLKKALHFRLFSKKKIISTEELAEVLVKIGSAKTIKDAKSQIDDLCKRKELWLGHVGFYFEKEEPNIKITKTKYYHGV